MNLDIIKDALAREKCSPELEKTFQQALSNLEAGQFQELKGFGQNIASQPGASMTLKHLALSLEQMAATGG